MRVCIIKLKWKRGKKILVHAHAHFLLHSLHIFHSNANVSNIWPFVINVSVSGKLYFVLIHSIKHNWCWWPLTTIDHSFTGHLHWLLEQVLVVCGCFLSHYFILEQGWPRIRKYSNPCLEQELRSPCLERAENKGCHSMGKLVHTSFESLGKRFSY